jgi:hypothetical protein
MIQSDTSLRCEDIAAQSVPPRLMTSVILLLKMGVRPSLGLGIAIASCLVPGAESLAGKRRTLNPTSEPPTFPSIPRADSTRIRVHPPCWSRHACTLHPNHESLSSAT